VSDIRFDVPSLQRAGGGMREAADDLIARTQAVLADCGDLSALGTYDTLGALASAMYAAVLDRVQDTVSSIAEATDEHGLALGRAAEMYQATEDANVALGQGMLR